MKASPTKGEVWRGGRTNRWRQIADSLRPTARQWVEAKRPTSVSTKKGQPVWIDLKEAATYSPTTKCSTIGVSELNFSVRNGKRWDLAAIATLILSIFSIVFRVH